MAPEDIAEQLVTKWQNEGKMPQMSWDFRGFAAAAAKIAQDAEREGCAEVADFAHRWIGEWEARYGSASIAEAIRMRSNVKVRGWPPRTAARVMASPACNAKSKLLTASPA